MTVKIDSATIISSLETAIELNDEKMSHKLLGELLVCFLFDLEFRLFGRLAYLTLMEKFMHTSPVANKAQNYCL